MNADLLSFVRESLTKNSGRLHKIATETGVPYTTLQRIKSAKNDPGYSKVRRLADFFAAEEARQKASV